MSRVLRGAGRSGGGVESLWVSYESGFDMGFFFLYFSLISLLFLGGGGGSVPLGCFLSLYGSWFFL